MVKESKLSRSEMVAIAGGLLLILSLFLPWYELENSRVAIDDVQGPVTLSGWDVHGLARWLLLAAALAPLILSYIILRGHALSWPRGEMTAVSSVAAFGLIAYMTLVDRPGTVSSLVSLKYGVALALLGSLLMLGGSALRASSVERPRKPPGVL